MFPRVFILCRFLSFWKSIFAVCLVMLGDLSCHNLFFLPSVLFPWVRFICVWNLEPASWQYFSGYFQKQVFVCYFWVPWLVWSVLQCSSISSHLVLSRIWPSMDQTLWSGLPIPLTLRGTCRISCHAALANVSSLHYLFCYLFCLAYFYEKVWGYLKKLLQFWFCC